MIKGHYARIESGKPQSLLLARRLGRHKSLMACMSSVGEWVESGLPLTVSQPSNSRNWVVFICKVRREPSLHVTTAHTYPGANFRQCRSEAQRILQQATARDQTKSQLGEKSPCGAPGSVSQRRSCTSPHLRLAIRQWRAFGVLTTRTLRKPCPNSFQEDAGRSDHAKRSAHHKH